MTHYQLIICHSDCGLTLTDPSLSFHLSLAVGLLSETTWIHSPGLLLAHRLQGCPTQPMAGRILQA